MVIDVTGYQFLDESTNPEIKELMKKWKMSNENYSLLKRRDKFISSTVSDKDYLKLKDIFNILKTEEDYKEYKKAFDYLCRYCHIVPSGTIISKYQLSKGKDDDMNNILVEYIANTKTINLPENIVLYHNSPVDGIKELIPKFRLRGRDENGYLCDKPRIYLTISEKLPNRFTDNDIIRKINTNDKSPGKMHLYEVVKNPSKIFIDPMLPSSISKCIYVETDEPLPVVQIK